MIGDLGRLAEALAEGSRKDAAILDTALVVAFWSCAWLSEVTYRLCDTPGNGGPGVLARDVKWGAGDSWAHISLRESKTAAPGELQTLRVNGIDNCLCPVAALRRLVSSCTGPTAPLFGYHLNGTRAALTKGTLTARFAEVWNDMGRPSLSGHSFRVGGASFQHAMRVPVADICLAGQWRSSCYKLYIRNYLPAELDETVEFLVLLDSAWCM